MADSRGEKLLEAILGDGTETEPAESRTEKLLERLLEQGGGGGQSSDFLVHVDLDADSVTGNPITGTMDKTAGEIFQAYHSGSRVILSGNLYFIADGLYLDASISTVLTHHTNGAKLIMLQAYAVYPGSPNTFVTLIIPFSTGDTTDIELYLDTFNSNS